MPSETARNCVAARGGRQQSSVASRLPSTSPATCIFPCEHPRPRREIPRCPIARLWPFPGVPVTRPPISSVSRRRFSIIGESPRISGISLPAASAHEDVSVAEHARAWFFARPSGQLCRRQLRDLRRGQLRLNSCGQRRPSDCNAKRPDEMSCKRSSKLARQVISLLADSKNNRTAATAKIIASSGWQSRSRGPPASFPRRRVRERCARHSECLPPRLRPFPRGAPRQVLACHSFASVAPRNPLREVPTSNGIAELAQVPAA